MSVMTEACSVNLNAGDWDAHISRCGAEAVYRAWMANCAGCALYGLPCRGHAVCVEHGAALRTTALRDIGEDGSAVEARLMRICSLAGGPS